MHTQLSDANTAHVLVMHSMCLCSTQLYNFVVEPNGWAMRTVCELLWDVSFGRAVLFAGMAQLVFYLC